jgi:hypothetical protein
MIACKNDLCSCMQAILASGQQGLRAMKACCSSFRLWKRQLSAQCLPVPCPPACSSAAAGLTSYTSSQLKQQRAIARLTLTYLIERAAVRHLPHWLCLLAATCAPPWCGRGTPQIPVISMHNYWPSRRVPDITRPLALPVGCSLNVRCSPACCFSRFQCAWHRRQIQCMNIDSGPGGVWLSGAF